jgi:ADP-heptose:LPS heptosyltransferase
MKPHVLVARLDSVGDVLLAGPAIRAVADGAARVTLMCGPRGRAAADLLPGVDAVLEWCAPWIDPEPGPIVRAEVVALVDRLAARRLDQAIVLTSFHQSPLPLALLLRMGGVRRIAATSPDYPGSLLDVRHHIAEDVHEVERSLSLVSTLGYTLPAGDDGALAIEMSGPGKIAARLPTPYVVVHPGASVPARAWDPQRHARLVDELVDDGHRVVVTGGADEAGLTAEVAGPSRRRVVDLGGRTDLAELAGVLARAETAVVGNTGPAHLAAAVGTPVVSLYAPTVPASRWRPWGVRTHVLGNQEIECAGCRARICPVEGHPCLGAVEVGEVVAAVGDLTGNCRTGVPPSRHRCSISPPSPQRTAVTR